MKLHTTKRSPYGRKVYVMAIEKGLKNQVELVLEDMKNKTPELLKANPIGAVPTLIPDKGRPLFDSPVIAEYIDSLNKAPRLIPGGKTKKLYVYKISAVADAMTEMAVALFYENQKAEEMREEAKIKKNQDALKRCFKYLDKEVKRFSKELNMAQIAVGAALGYIGFRHPDLDWKTKNQKLAEWFAEFSKRPSMKETEPRD